MGRLIDVDNIEYYLEEGGSVVAFKADIEQIPTADIDTDSAYAEGWTAAESKYRAMMSDGDCISRQETIRWVKTECNPYGKPTLDFETCKKVVEHLKQMPSAQPEIIRCKECRWGREVCGNIECFADTNVPPEYHGYEWFCPNGERRIDG